MPEGTSGGSVSSMWLVALRAYLVEARAAFLTFRWHTCALQPNGSEQRSSAVTLYNGLSPSLSL